MKIWMIIPCKYTKQKYSYVASYLCMYICIYMFKLCYILAMYLYVCTYVRQLGGHLRM